MAKKDLQGKKFLHQLLKIQLQIDEKTDELNYWKSQLELCCNDPHLVKNIWQRSDELAALILKMNEQKILATNLIDSLDDPVGRAILRRRYILCESWQDIALACGRMCERNAHYIHDKALLDFVEIYCGSKAAVV